MQKKRNTISINKNDFLLGILCLLGMFIALYMFWKDLNISFAKANEPKIAVIYFKHNTAQRRLRDRNVWERLQQSSIIFNGDRIRTATDSEAYAIFNDGTRIDLHENTLIQVFDTKKGNNISFINGAISVTSVSEIPSVTILTSGKAISLEENTTATLNTTITNQITAVVSTGSINIVEVQNQTKPKTNFDLFNIINNQIPQQNNQEEIYIQPDSISTTNSKVKVSAGNSISFATNTNTPSQSTQIIPSKSEIFLPTTTYSVMHNTNEIPLLPVTWKSSEPLIMRFSRNSSFSEIIETRELPSNESNLVLQLDFTESEDIIYWQIVSKNYEKTTEQYKSGVIYVKVLENAQLEENMTQVFGTKQAKLIQQQIIDTDKQITELLTTTQNKQELPTTNQLDTVETESSTSLTQIKTQLENTPQEPLIISITPELTSPIKNRKFIETDFISENPKINFTWKKVKDADSYTFSLFSNSKLLKTIKVINPSFVLEGEDLSFIDNGTFTWRIVANQTLNNTEYNSNPSESSFEVNLSSVGDIEIDRSTLLDAE